MGKQAEVRGREDELAVVGTAVESAVRGHSSILVIDGRAGIGKTCLMTAAAERAAAAGLRVGSGRADPDSRVVPMMALMSALFSGPRPLLDRGRLRDLPSSPEQRFWLIQELAALLEEAALAEPLLVTVDDLHWADPGTLAALRILPEQLADLPIMWLVSHGSEEEDADAAAVLAKLGVMNSRRIVLRPLDGAAVLEIIVDILGADPDAELIRLAASAGGHPFLLTELLHGLLSEERVRVLGDNAHLVGRGLPVRVCQSMRVRLGQRSAAARDVVGVAAALGRRFTHDQLAAMLDASHVTLLEPIGELLRAGLIVEDGDHFAFGHDLIRAAVLSALPASAGRVLQRRAVDVFLAEGAVPTEVARQLAASAEPGDRAAISLLARAADALALSDSSAAADLAVRALDLNDHDDTTRGPLTARAAILLLAAGRSSEGSALALGALDALPGAAQQAELCLAIAEMTAIPAHIRAQACRSALALPALSDVMRLRLQARLAYSLTHEGSLVPAQAALAAIDDKAVADPAAWWTCEITRRSLDLMEDRYGDALERSRQLRRSGEAGKPLHALHVDYVVIEALALRDDFDEALRLSSDCVATSQRDGKIWEIGSYERQRGRLWAAAGRLPDASAALERISPGLESNKVRNTGDAAALEALGRVALHTGNDSMRELCRQAARKAVAALPAEPRRHAMWMLALQLMATGDAIAARGLITDGLAPDEPALPTCFNDPAAPVDLVRIALACGDADLADEAVAIAERRAERNPGIASLAAIAAHARGLRARDVIQVAHAVREFTVSPRRVAMASAIEDLGRLLVAGGQTADGAAKLGEALKLYAAMGATWDATRTRARLRRLGIRRNLQSAPCRDRSWAGLTDSELAVVRLVSAGHTNNEIAGRLYLSPYTVNAHLRHVFTKLGIRARTDLVRLYLSQHPA